MEKNLWSCYEPSQLQELEHISTCYRDFLSAGKTERECVQQAVYLAEQAGYRPLDGNVAPGDRVYITGMGKMAVFFQLGRTPVSQGLNILGAHIDSPRLDVKQKPLYEESGLAYFDLHYYGGIKKYQWVALPLAIHGIVVRKDGSVCPVCIGEEPGDPVVCITDLLPHLASEQMEKKADKVIDGESMDLLVGSKALSSAEEDAVRANVLQLLQERYQIEEEDLLSAELEIVPAGQPREAGLDRSMLLAYGHDDRVCAYSSLYALLNTPDTQRTTCCFLVDKEETASAGATSAQSDFFKNALAELLEACGGFSELALRRCLQKSVMLSSDVTAAFDPLYPSVFEKRSCAYLGGGINFSKYLGARGKVSTNDANPEFIAQIRRIMDEAQVHYQMSELGRVDAGGGGTIASLFAQYGMQVLDCGVPVLSMHSPWELVSKADLYEAVRCYQAFLQNADHLV